MEQVILAVCTLVSDLRSDREVTSGRKLLEMVGKQLKVPAIPRLLQVDLRGVSLTPEIPEISSSARVNTITRVSTRHNAWTLRNEPKMLAMLEEPDTDSVEIETILDLTHVCALLDTQEEPSFSFQALEMWAPDAPRALDDEVEDAERNGLLLRNIAQVRWITVEGDFFQRSRLLGRCKGLRFREFTCRGYSWFEKHDYDPSLPSWRGSLHMALSDRLTNPSEVRTALAAYGR